MPLGQWGFSYLLSVNRKAKKVKKECLLEYNWCTSSIIAIKKKKYLKLYLSVIEKEVHTQAQFLVHLFQLSAASE